MKKRRCKSVWVLIFNPEPIKAGSPATERWQLTMDGHGNIHGRKKHSRAGVHLSAEEIVMKLRLLQTGELWI